MKRKKGKRVLKWIAWIAVVMIVCVGALAFWGWSIASEQYKGETTWLHLPTGSSAEAVSDSLRNVLGSDFGDKVARLWQLQGGKPRIAAGAYQVSAGADAWTLSRRLLHGLQDQVKVTFNNVRTMPQLAERITSNLEMDASDFMAACDSMLPQHGFSAEEYPAAFLPDTYYFYWNVKPKAMVDRMMTIYDKAWTADRRMKAEALGLSPAQVATLASIVEGETNKADEKPLVARLYLNRLDRGMPLQADPTVKYAVGDFTLRRILNSHLQTPSPYNTYLHKGLPPGPICVPALSSIDAVLDAPKHTYIYMCAKEDFSGYHNFASDYNTHLQNARRYQAELNKRNIR